MRQAVEARAPSTRASGRRRCAGEGRGAGAGMERGGRAAAGAVLRGLRRRRSEKRAGEKRRRRRRCVCFFSPFDSIRRETDVGVVRSCVRGCGWLFGRVLFFIKYLFLK